MDELLERLRAELRDRYVIEHELGRGGMAFVFLARDIRHDRNVAVKVLRPDVDVAGAGDRFVREIRTAAQLQHPHILPLYDSGKAGDDLFYVMPYVEGESLRQRLEREGPLPVDVAMRIAREVADALDFAHRREVVHRDIKPENILLSAGHAMVADFGIARAADAAGLKLTETGLALGTPAYMSPEQATADPRVDGRADQYALGCVVYEMLAGGPPFSGSSSQAIMARHTRDAVPPLNTVRPVPPALEGAIRRALEKVPGDRWPTTTAFADALEATMTGRASGDDKPTPAKRFRLRSALAAAATIAVMGVASAYGLRASREHDRTSADGKNEGLQSVAVLPFTYSGDSSSAVIADGMTEGLITGLVRVEGLRVPASDRILAYRDKKEDPIRIGQNLGVAAIVSAGVQVIGNRLRVIAQLVDVSDGTLLWRDTFDGELLLDGVPRDLFAIQDELAGRIVDALRPKLSPHARAAVAQGVRTKDLEAYALYQRARRVTAVRTPENWRTARELLRRAVARDSSFSDAWVYLWEAEASYHGTSGHPPREIIASTKGLLDRAIAADSLNGRAYATRAIHRSWNEWDFAGANADLKKAVQLSPGVPEVLMARAFNLAEYGQRDSALAYAKRAWALDPQNPAAWADLAFITYFAGDPDSALRVYRQAIALDSTTWTTYFTGMHVFLDAGNRGKADESADKYLGLGGYCCSQSLAYASVYYRRTGNKTKLKEMLDSVTSLSRRQYVSGSEIATAKLGVGDVSGALDALETAYREHDVMLADNLAFTLSPLAGNPRYEAIKAKVYGDYPVPRLVFQ